MSVPCDKEAVLTTLQVKQAEIQGQIGLVAADVLHVKGRIDNGMSKTISEMHSLLIRLEPQIEEHADLYKRIKDAGWLMFYIFLGMTFGVIVWAITKGFMPKI